MARIRFDFGTVTLEAELFDTPTARAVAAALPISSAALTWGEEVYFTVPVKVARAPQARAVVYMVNLPLDTNVLFMTVMANLMPFVGRG